MKISSLKFLILFICLSLLPKVFADPTEIEAKEALRMISGMNSFAVDFIQTDSKGVRASGTLLINKPYNFRCNYYPPFPLLIVGNKNYISMYDYQMEALSRMSANENIFNFLLMNHIDICKHFAVTVLSNDGGNLRIQLHHEETGRYSEILVDKTSKQLRELKIFEPKNIITIRFSNIRTVSGFDEDLFMLQTPTAGIQVEQFNREQLKQKFE